MHDRPRPAPAPPSQFERPPLQAVALLGLLLASCDSDFEPYGKLSSLRVLAIQSEPAAPAPGEIATLTPLLYAPGGAALSASWSWCPVEVLAADGGGCLLDEEEASQALGSAVGYDLGSGPVARFEHAFEPANLARFCSGAALIAAGLGAVDCSDGLPVQIRLVVSAGGDRVESARRLRLRFAPEQLENRNPALDGVSARVSDAPVPLDDLGTFLLSRGAEVELEARVSESASEAVTRAESERQRERLVFSWFVDAGETEYERTSFVEGELPLERATRNVWTLPPRAEHEADEAHLIVVVRDDRGGVGWHEARVALEGGAP